MTREFTPQVTTHRNYEAQERAIFAAFRSQFGDVKAGAIATTHTSFQLGYLTVNEVVDCLLRAGLEENQAVSLATAFAMAQAKAAASRPDMATARHEHKEFTKAHAH